MDTNISLERDPRYTSAKQKLTDLQHQLTGLELERSHSLDLMNQKSIDSKPQKSRLDLQAESLLDNGSDSDIPISANAARKTYAELTEKIVVVMRAITIQRSRLADLTDEISKEIAAECLPQHQSNVAAIVGALLKLEAALAAESGLRDDLFHNGIAYQSHIRPMPLRGIGLLSDHQSAVSRYLLECLDHKFITIKDLPESLHKHIPSRAETTQPEGKSRKSDWVNA